MLGMPHLSLLIVNEKQQLTKPSSVGVTPEFGDVALNVSDAPGPDDDEVLTPEIPAPMTPEAGPLCGVTGLTLSWGL